MRMEHEQSGKRGERKSCGWLLLDNHDEEWMYYRQKQTVSLSRNLCNTRREDMTASKKSMDWNQTRSWRARAFTQWLNDKNVERVPACEIQPFTVGLGVFYFQNTRATIEFGIIFPYECEKDTFLPLSESLNWCKSTTRRRLNLRILDHLLAVVSVCHRIDNWEANHAKKKQVDCVSICFAGHFTGSKSTFIYWRYC